MKHTYCHSDILIHYANRPTSSRCTSFTDMDEKDSKLLGEFGHGAALEVLSTGITRAAYCVSISTSRQDTIEVRWDGLLKTNWHAPGCCFVSFEAGQEENNTGWTCFYLCRIHCLVQLWNLAYIIKRNGGGRGVLATLVFCCDQRPLTEHAQLRRPVGSNHWLSGHSFFPSWSVLHLYRHLNVLVISNVVVDATRVYTTRTCFCLYKVTRLICASPGNQKVVQLVTNPSTTL